MVHRLTMTTFEAPEPLNLSPSKDEGQAPAGCKKYLHLTPP